MKRRIKVFSAIASLCLAVALMAFGVYAATQVDYKVSGTVTYTVTDVLVKVTTNIYAATDSTKGYTAVEDGIDATTALNGVQWNEEDAVATDTFQTYDANGANSVGAGVYDDEALAYNIDFADSTAYKIVIEIATVQKDKDVTVAVTLESTGDNYSLGADKTTAGKSSFTVAKSTEQGVTAGATTTLTYFVYLNDATKSVTGANYSIKLSMTQAA